jgi:hypothetical protein
MTPPLTATKGSCPGCVDDHRIEADPACSSAAKSCQVLLGLWGSKLPSPLVPLASLGLVRRDTLHLHSGEFGRIKSGRKPNRRQRQILRRPSKKQPRAHNIRLVEIPFPLGNELFGRLSFLG